MKAKTDEKKFKVFLGGTCNGSDWRSKLIPLLKCDYFNPVVDDWTPECQKKEIIERANSDIRLYTITDDMIGVYSIAEVVEDSMVSPSRTVFCNLKSHMDDQSIPEVRSMVAVENMVLRHGAIVVRSIEDCADMINLIYAANTDTEFIPISKEQRDKINHSGEVVL